jgi:ATP-binding cassette subfamily B protein/subfamily B ATP-binding cassette protein MsbA
MSRILSGLLHPWQPIKSIGGLFETLSAMTSRASARGRTDTRQGRSIMQQTHASRHPDPSQKRSGMGSFLRVVRMSLRYRWTIAVSLTSSLLVGLFWGLNITTLYPVMEVVFRGESLHSTLDGQVKKLAVEVETLRQEAAAAGDGVDAKLAASEKALALVEWVKPYVDRWFPEDPFQTLLFVFGVAMVGTVIKGVFMGISTYSVGRLTQVTVFDLRNEFFRRTLRMDLQIFDRDRSSGLVSRSTYDFDRLSEGLGTLYAQGVREPIKMLSCLVGAALICWQLLMVSLLAIPLGFGVIRLLSRIIKETTKSQMNFVHALYHRLDESFAGIKTIRIFARERHERHRFYLAGKRFLQLKRQLFFVSLFKPVSETLGMAGVTLAVLTGSYLVLSGQTHLFGIPMCARPLSPAALFLFYAFLVGLAEPARKMSGVGTQLWVGAAAAERIFSFIDAPPKIADPLRPVALRTRQPEIEIDHLWFAYQADQPVLCDVSLTIPFGRTVAIVGPNGCGKSTLVNLLPRLYDPTKGRLLLDGIDIRQLRQRELRSLIGVVSQDTVLFDDTLMANIRYGRPGATDDEVIEAARQAQIHDFIVNDLSSGYDTVVGQRGSRLSSGQRQRIALARVILRDPSILILDEATSHIDLESERLIHSALERFLVRRTTILVTHRPSALRLAEQVVVMDAGRIVDCGTNEELLARCGLYQRLYRRERAIAA